VDSYAVCDLMDDRGWNLDRNAIANALHMMISPLHAPSPTFVSDLAWAARAASVARGVEARYN
jgi:hypothetical protein